MNYRIQRKKLRMSLPEAAALLHVQPEALRQYENSLEPWPEGLREKYLLVILNHMKDKALSL